MKHPYEEMYLEDAMDILGEALEYAVYSCGMKMDDFMALFTAHRYSKWFESGDPWAITGHSGTELVMEVLGDAKPGFFFLTF